MERPVHRVIRTFVALLAVLALLAGNAEAFRHHHGSADGAARCPECLALAASGAAIVVVAQYCAESSGAFEPVVTTVVESSFVLLPAIDCCRGPPVLA